jgi:hypothetical protein
MRTLLLLFALLASTAHADPPRSIELAMSPRGLLTSAHTGSAAAPARCCKPVSRSE